MEKQTIKAAILKLKTGTGTQSNDLLLYLIVSQTMIKVPRQPRQPEGSPKYAERNDTSAVMVDRDWPKGAN